MAIDLEQFRSLALSELPSLYRLASHLAHGPIDPDDLVQETYLRAFKAQHTFKLSDTGIRPWLMRILHNVFFTRVKRSRLEPTATDFAADVADKDVDARSLPHQTLADLDWDRIDERLKRAIQSLPPAYRIVFLLCSVEDLKYREVSEVLDLPIGTVMSRLFRARTQLLNELKPVRDDLGMRQSSPGPVDENKPPES